MFLDGFVHALREEGIAVGMTEVLDFYRGLEKGLGPDLESLFLFGRLCFVRRVERMDAYERVFLRHFFGIDVPRVAKGDPELLHTRPFQEWLRRQVEEGELPPHALWSLGPEELMERFWKTLEEQLEEHHGGSQWIGTGGNSPFGHSGNASGGVRVGGTSKNRSALKVFGERRYVDYADDRTLEGESLGQALSVLKRLVPAGPKDVLDVGETVHRSARNAGEIELVFEKDLKDRLEVLLLLDNGGTSMLPWVGLVRMLFGKMRDRFERLDTYFFRNSIYGNVFADPRRRQPVPTAELLERSPETRLIVLGDASMAPEELHARRGAIEWGTDDAEPSTVWLERLRERFPAALWLNPIPEPDWPRTHGRRTIEAVARIFPMEDLTLGGIKRGVERLNRPQAG